MTWKELFHNDKVSAWQLILAAIGVLAALVTALLAYDIGVKQNDINERALKMNNFVELFIQPKSYQYTEGNIPKTGWVIAVQNISSFPVYLNGYTLNGERRQIGSNALPASGDGWYEIPIPKSAEEKGSVSLEIEFEDYLGKRYRSEGSGTFMNGIFTNIQAKKRIEL